MVFTPTLPLVENNTIKLWYGGSKATHGAPEDSAQAGIGLATLRKDGFASLDAAKAVGIVTTRPLKNLHGLLRINANAGAGSLKVEVLTENGKVLPGFSCTECKTIRSDDNNIQVTWRHHKFLPDSPGVLRLRFILRNASLYSFTGGEGVDLAHPVKPKDIHLTFEKTNKSQQESLFNGKVSKGTTNFSPSYRIHGNVSIEDDSANAAKGLGVARFSSVTSQSANKIELLNTTNLGHQFTLSSMVKTPNKRLTRLFSNYRGSGELVTGELLFDFDQQVLKFRVCALMSMDRQLCRNH